MVFCVHLQLIGVENFIDLQTIKTSIASGRDFPGFEILPRAIGRPFPVWASESES